MVIINHIKLSNQGKLHRLHYCLLEECQHTQMYIHTQMHVHTCTHVLSARTAARLETEIPQAGLPCNYYVILFFRKMSLSRWNESGREIGKNTHLGSLGINMKVVLFLTFFA